MRAALAVLVIANATPALAAGRIPYGSRVGMEVTITGMEGIGSASAVIRVKHTPENAREFCVQYSNDRSRKCVEQTLRETRLNDELRGNCRAGTFTNLFGDNVVFKGRNKSKEEGAPRYVLIGSDGMFDGSSASGYTEVLSQFQALCPALVDRIE